ncbi:MAG: STAS domain-containing protein [Candidatus Poribacteria bacterium]|nr:STAS domain-containing protein [Candidatus Poribacteria bacterium]MDE0313804.1 STAS domain-containing protein [Candidatus Poribacteria bacterium]
MTTKVRREKGITILEPKGKIMGSSASELWAEISPQIEGSDTPRILINFEHVNKVDSTGLGVMMKARAVVARKKGRVGVINVSKHIGNLIVMSRLVSLFERFDNEAAAVSRLSA